MILVIKKYSAIMASTIVLLVILAGIIVYGNRLTGKDNWGYTDEQIMEYGPFWITVPADENDGLVRDINGVVLDEDPDSIYLILPKGINEKKVVVYIRDGYESNYEARRELNLENGESVVAGKKVKSIVSQIPILFFETNEESISHYELKESTYDNPDAFCTGNIASDDMSCDYEATIKLRGNGTRELNKKPYSLKLESAHNLFGLGKHKKWNLLADTIDKSLLKNYTFLKLSQKIGVEYEPECMHVLLYIDNDFQGVYLLTTKVTVGSNEIKLGNDDFLFVWKGTKPAQPVKYESKFDVMGDESLPYTHIDIAYPKEESEERLEEKRKIVQKYVDAADAEDDAADLNSYLDLESFAKAYWVQEISMNADAARRSLYSIYRDSTKKIYYAPVWDMDLTLGFGSDCEGVSLAEPEGWKVRNMGLYKALFRHREVLDAVRDAYFKGGIRDSMIESLSEFDNEREKILNVGKMNYMMWGNERVEYVSEYDVNTYEEYVEKVKEFYMRRIEWIDNQMNKDR